MMMIDDDDDDRDSDDVAQVQVAVGKEAEEELVTFHSDHHPLKIPPCCSQCFITYF